MLNASQANVRIRAEAKELERIAYNFDLGHGLPRADVEKHLDELDAAIAMIRVVFKLEEE